MHRHNGGNKSNEHKGMMWMMVPCLLLFGIVFLGGGKISPSGYPWLVLIGGFVILHVWMMFKGHGGHDHGSDKK
jgi:thiosulfate reductase cytochrome b subunit